MNTKELHNLISQGETYQIEFKESLNSSFGKELCAFANSKGGTVLIGITDDGKIKPTKQSNSKISQVQTFARNMYPSMILDVKNIDDVIVVNVPEGDDKPYSVNGQFYIRQGANSQKLNRDEILSFGVKELKIRFDEQICTEFNFRDFDDSKFDYFTKLANISNNLSRDELLSNLNLLTHKGFTNAGVLLFAKKPSKYIQSSIIRNVHFNDDSRTEILDKKEIDDGILNNIEFSINYLKQRVPVKYQIKGMRREECSEYPEEAYREAIVNAIIHRDYFEMNADVVVEKLKNSIHINNPGGLVDNFPINNFGKMSFPRNRLLARTVSKTIYMEKAGTGIKRIMNYCDTNKNKVKFDYKDNFFFVDIFKNTDTVKDTLKDTVKDTVSLSKNQKKMMELILKNPNVTIVELSKAVGINERNIKNNISKLKQKKILKRIGSDKNGRWKIK